LLLLHSFPAKVQLTVEIAQAHLEFGNTPIGENHFSKKRARVKKSRYALIGGEGRKVKK